jgi:hypothetical protein
MMAVPDPTGGLLSYGVLGILVVLLLTGQLVPGWLYKRSEAENDRLRKVIDDKVYPTIDASTEATRKAVQLADDLLRADADRARRPPRRGAAE